VKLVIAMARLHTRSSKDPAVSDSEQEALDSEFGSLKLDSPNLPTPPPDAHAVSPRAPSPNPFQSDSSSNAAASQSKSEADPPRIVDIVVKLRDLEDMTLHMEDVIIRAEVAEVLYYYYPVRGKRKKSDEITVHSTITNTPSKQNDRGGSLSCSDTRLVDWLRLAGMEYCPVSGELRGDKAHVLLPKCFERKNEKAVCNLLPFL
jgi:hypothetical protein